MATYTQIYYHIIYGTKFRNPTLEKSDREKLFKYIWGILNKKKCHLYRINGVDDHIHIFTSLHPSVSLSNLVKDIKLASTSFIKQEKIFPKFSGWQDGYSGFTHNIKEKHRLIEYVKNQELHHKTFSYKEELIELFKENGVIFEEKYLV